MKNSRRQRFIRLKIRYFFPNNFRRKLISSLQFSRIIHVDDSSFRKNLIFFFRRIYVENVFLQQPFCRKIRVDSIIFVQKSNLFFWRIYVKNIFLRLPFLRKINVDSGSLFKSKSSFEKNQFDTKEVIYTLREYKRGYL